MTDSLTIDRDAQGRPRVRLRCGKARHRIVLPEASEARLLHRAKLLQELASCIRDQPDAKSILQEAASAPESEVRAAISRLQAKQRKPTKKTAVTFKDVGSDWTSGRLHEQWPDHVKAKVTSDLDATRLDSIYAVSCGGTTFGALPIAEISLDDAEIVMRNLPDSAKRPGTRRRGKAFQPGSGPLATPRVYRTTSYAHLLRHWSDDLSYSNAHLGAAPRGRGGTRDLPEPRKLTRWATSLVAGRRGTPARASQGSPPVTRRRNRRGTVDANW